MVGWRLLLRLPLHDQSRKRNTDCHRAAPPTKLQSEICRAVPGGVSSLGKFPGYLGRECHLDIPETTSSARLTLRRRWGAAVSFQAFASRSPSPVPEPSSSQHSYAVSVGGRTSPAPTQRGLPAAFAWLTLEEEKMRPTPCLPLRSFLSPIS